MPMKREYRQIKTSQLRARQDGKGIEGYAAVFNKVSEDLGWFRETVKPGAFQRCLGTNPDVRCLFNHEASAVLGRTTSGTLRLTEDRTGLHFDCDMPDTQMARDLRTSIERGDIDQCSFGFIVQEQNWLESKDKEGKIQTTRELVDVDLFDVSVVTYPAYPQTSVSIRALWPDGEPEEVLEHREKKTKRVDGEDLTAGDFLYVGDPDKTETWKLPWKFSTEEKTKSHLRNALARFNQADIPSEEKDKVWKKLVRLCKEHDIEVSEDKSLHRAMENDEGCECQCPECQANNCGQCSSVACDDDNCEHDKPAMTNMDGMTETARARIRVALAQ